MKSKALILAWCLFFMGFIFCMSSLINILTYKIRMGYPIQLILACLLMICSALLVARVELTRIENRIGKSEGVWDELDARVRGLERKKGRVSSWRFTDLEYRVAELEKKVGD